MEPPPLTPPKNHCYLDHSDHDNDYYHKFHHDIDRFGFDNWYIA